eukprot:scaffold11869_cov30-Tisochrysis_lutea.AAC.8
MGRTLAGMGGLSFAGCIEAGNERESKSWGKRAEGGASGEGGSLRWLGIFKGAGRPASRDPRDLGEKVRKPRKMRAALVASSARNAACLLLAAVLALEEGSGERE